MASVSLVLSRMPDVRAAFGTGDRLTIRDTAGEVWNKIRREGSIFLVTDPRGAILASLGTTPDFGQRPLGLVPAAAARFPGQAAGFLDRGGRLYQTVATPVYVASGEGSGLISVLVVGLLVDDALARELKEATGGSDFVFLSGETVVASTLGAGAWTKARLESAGQGKPARIRVGGADYAGFTTTLADVGGRSVGTLYILRAHQAALGRIASLRRNIVSVWLLAMLAGLLATWALARRLLRPVHELDRAAARVAEGDYAARVPEAGHDELGRLSATFNAMAGSLGAARQELIRRERISTIGRLSTSIVHDLRNPLAAIYGGAEMLVDEDLPPQQTRRLAANIYRASRRVQELLSDLSEVTRGRTQAPEPCLLGEVVQAAREVVAPAAEARAVKIEIDIPADLELPLERSRVERVFENLFSNAVEAMAEGGAVRVSSRRERESVVVQVEDDGPGIAPEIAPRLFEPFATHGKKNGIGLGLALSRQTLLDHGGDLWAEERSGRGACFLVRLPLGGQAPANLQ
jgi:signal transduction histidine kinase